MKPELFSRILEVLITSDIDIKPYTPVVGLHVTLRNGQEYVQYVPIDEYDKYVQVAEENGASIDAVGLSFHKNEDQEIDPW